MKNNNWVKYADRLLDDTSPQLVSRPRAVLYLRTATAGALDACGEDAAIRQQRADVRDMAERLGVRLVAEFSDVGASGTTLDRRGLRAMLERVGVGDIRIVLTRSLDRLSRDSTGLVVIRRALGRHSVRVHTVTETTWQQPDEE